jgi:hypothetical protein
MFVVLLSCRGFCRLSRVPSFSVVFSKRP